MILSLKNFQKYRNTIIIIGVLTIVVIGLSAMNYLIYQANQKSPLVITGQEVPGQNTNTNKIIPWTNIEVGQSYEEIIQKIGSKPSYEQQENEYRVIRYLFNPRNITKYHEFKFINNRAVYIKRALDPIYEIFKAKQLTDKYGPPEILQKGYNIEVRSLYKYKIEKDNILVADVYEAQQEIFELHTMTPSEFEKFNTKIETTTPEGVHNLEPESIVD